MNGTRLVPAALAVALLAAVLSAATLCGGKREALATPRPAVFHAL